VVIDAVVCCVGWVGDTTERINVVNIIARSVRRRLDFSTRDVVSACVAHVVSIILLAASSTNDDVSAHVIVGIASGGSKECEAVLGRFEVVGDPEAVISFLVQVSLRDDLVGVASEVKCALVVEVFVSRASLGRGGRDRGGWHRRGVLEAAVAVLDFAAAAGAVHLESILHNTTAQTLWFEECGQGVASNGPSDIQIPIVGYLAFAFWGSG
jgi:hypothetical protein